MPVTQGKIESIFHVQWKNKGHLIKPSRQVFCPCTPAFPECLTKWFVCCFLGEPAWLELKKEVFWTWQHSSIKVKKSTEVHLLGKAAVGTISQSNYSYRNWLYKPGVLSALCWHLNTANTWQRRILYVLNADWCFPLCPASKGRKMHYKTVFIMHPCKMPAYCKSGMYLFAFCSVGNWGLEWMDTAEVRQ